MQKHFESRMKLADVIAYNHTLILVLQRLNIPLGFGEKSVREVCEANDVPVEFMLLICNVYTFKDYMPAVEELSTTDMSLLVPYLKASHDYYIKERLPHIELHLNHIADKIGGKYGDILKKFYADFRKEIEAHFECEEQFDFPRLQTLQSGKKVKGGLRKHYENSHTSLVDKLSDLTQIVYKYLPGNVMPAETMELVFDILQLSFDIQKHAAVEERILTPYVKWLERSKK